MGRLVIRLVAFAILLLTVNAALQALALRPLAPRCDPRTRVLYARDLGTYPVALLGESVFSSFYVDREEQTLWRRLEQETGLPVFPGALDGARAGDILATARYMGGRLPAGAIVFVESHPANTWLAGEERYRDRFFVGGFLYGELGPVRSAWNAWGQPLVADLLRTREMLGRSRPKATFFGVGPQADRAWDADDEGALDRFRLLEEHVAMGKLAFAPDLGAVQRVHDTLRGAGLRPVLVLTPLNGWEIERYSSPGGARTIRSLFDERHRQLLAFFQEKGIPHVDLYQAVPSPGFSDLIHTNATGDRIMARALAEAVRAAGGASAGPR